jgi:hypothetical protein
MNGFEVAGKRLKVAHKTEKGQAAPPQAPGAQRFAPY